MSWITIKFDVGTLNRVGVPDCSSGCIMISNDVHRDNNIALVLQQEYTYREHKTPVLR